MTEGLHGPRQLCREEGERRRGPGGRAVQYWKDPGAWTCAHSRQVTGAEGREGGPSGRDWNSVCLQGYNDAGTFSSAMWGSGTCC